MGKQFKMKQVASAILLAGLASVGVAAHATNVDGGGSTLAQPLYNEEMRITASAFGITSTSDTWTFGGVGSGAGRLGFFNDDITQDFPGHAATTVHYGASDAAMTAAEYNAYIASTGKGNLASSSGDGRMIEIPMMVTPVIIFNKGTTNASARNVVVSTSDLCRIFSGQITNWNQLTKPGGGSFSSEPFKVIYRSESSGTTTLLTQHLAAVCTDHTSTGTNGVIFHGKGVFADEFGDDLGEPSLPSNFVAATGSGGVQAALATSPNTNPAAFTYLSPDPQYTPPASVEQSKLNNHNLTTGTTSFLPTTAAVAAAVAGKLTTPSGPTATLETDSTASGYTAVTNAAYPLNWVQLVSDPTNGYPIVGTTNMIVSQCYAGSRVAGGATVAETAVSNYLNAHLSNNARISAHDFVALPSTVVTAIKNAFITGSSNGGVLKIGASYCGTVAGR